MLSLMEKDKLAVPIKEAIARYINDEERRDCLLMAIVSILARFTLPDDSFIDQRDDLNEEDFALLLQTRNCLQSIPKVMGLMKRVTDRIQRRQVYRSRLPLAPVVGKTETRSDPLDLEEEHTPQCEGCKKPATCMDAEGVWLCEDCAKTCMAYRRNKGGITEAMSGKPRKPPLGIMPRDIWDENQQTHRANEVMGAIRRHLSQNLPFPPTWLDEIEELLLKPRLAKQQEA